MIKKMKFFFIIFGLCLLFSVNISAQSLGDIDENGSVDIIDALYIARMTVGNLTPDINWKMADVNLDNTVNILDALIIAQYYVGIYPYLPPFMKIEPLAYRVIKVPVVTLDMLEK